MCGHICKDNRKTQSNLSVWSVIMRIMRTTIRLRGLGLQIGATAHEGAFSLETPMIREMETVGGPV